ncbi:MAG: type II toxin-antitoxin system VapC family toxin, partial [Streptosporangiaceae bacterium]
MSGWRRYGKERHPAGLNFGDCFTYALAEQTGHPVLCTGDDFAATDIAVVRLHPTTEAANAELGQRHVQEHD